MKHRKAPICCKRPMKLIQAVPQGTNNTGWQIFFQCSKCGKWTEYFKDD